MSARLTMFLRGLVIGSCVVACTAVAQTDPQQRPNEHQANGQQRQADQTGGHNGQQQYRPPQQQGGQQSQQQQYQQQQQPQQRNGQQQYQQQQRGEQHQNTQQRTDRGQQQYRGEQQSGQQYRPDQHEQRGDQHQNTQQSNRGQQQYRNGNRPQQWGRPPANRPSYNFRANDRDSLRRYYSSRLRGIDRARRPVFRIGGYLPYEDIGFFSPVPPGAWGSLPPIPYGYAAGYWDGYVIVYDPNTGYILYVSDLMY